MSMKEIWREIKEARNYEVSNFGRVRVKATRKIKKIQVKSRQVQLITWQNKELEERYNSDFWGVKRSISRPVGDLVAEHFSNSEINHEEVCKNLNLKKDENVNLRTIGEKIKFFRKKQGITQNKLAEMCKVQKRKITNIELNRKDIDDYLMKKISEILNIDLKTV